MDALSSIAPVSLTPQPNAESLLNRREAEAHKELEAVFVSMLIKELRTAGLEDGLFPGDSSDTFGGMFDSFMSEELVEAGGIGLQRMFEKPAVPAPEDITHTHRLAKEAYGNAESAPGNTTSGS